MPVSSSMDVRDTLTPALREAAKALRDWRRFWPTAQSTIYKGITQIFNEKGPGWAPLAKSTPPRRKAGAKDYASALPLLASGRLRASVMSERGRDSTTAKEPLELRLGTSLAYAPAMHFGLPARTGQVREHLAGRKKGARGATIYKVRAHTVRLPKVPARPFIKFTPPMVRDIQTGAARYIEREFARGAGK